ncbi:hypothetical protein H0H87_000921, partial [Tephrocybe sp. NHM501043]
FQLSIQPLTSTAPDFPGFLPTIGAHTRDIYTQHHCGCDLAQDSYNSPIGFPPSPPPTNSDPKRSVPLPSLGLNAEAGPSSPRRRRFRESPRTTRRVVLSCATGTPMTPPPTVPTQTMDLPPATCQSLPIPTEHDVWDSSLPGLPPASSTPDQDNGMDPLLSPISPEWTTNGIPYDMPPTPPSTGDTSVLLGGNHNHFFPAPCSPPYFQESNDNNTSPRYRPILPHLDIPFHFQSPGSTWSESPTSSMDYDDELDMLATPSTMDMDMPSTPRSLPMTPFTHEHDFTSDDNFFVNDFRDEKYDYYIEPPLHEIEFLPELDDIPNSPSSPSLRSFSMLPALDEDDDDDLMLTSPPSPGATLVSLPVVDSDDFILPSNLELPKGHPDSDVPKSPFGSSSSSLLLLEDEGLPRSPSPENFDLDFTAVEDSPNPDIRHLGELRKRSLHAERAARQFEQTLMDQGAVHQRWEARRARKKEKERGREIGAMLRLKLAEERERLRVEAIEPEGEREGEKLMKKRKGAITSMEQLVAKMMLRRNDTYRSLANRKTPLTSKFYTRSPLVRFDEPDSDTDDLLENLTSFETVGEFDSESESEPWTPPGWTTALPQLSSASF